MERTPKSLSNEERGDPEKVVGTRTVAHVAPRFGVRMICETIRATAMDEGVAIDAPLIPRTSTLTE
jgi:hypothetical protein